MAVPKWRKPQDPAERTFAAEVAVNTAATGEVEIPAARGAAREFTLDITFSGLCLLVRQKKAKRLLVLLPDTRGHENDHKIPKHLAVLGAHERYEPEGPFEKKGRFFEYELGEGKLSFLPRLESGQALDLDFDPKTLDLADLTAVASHRPPVAGEARLEMAIVNGTICPDCGLDSGATWLFDRRKNRMATRVSWRITGVTNATSDGRLGVIIRYHEHEGYRDFVIRPVEDPHEGYRAAFYLYHAPESELPSKAGHPDVLKKEEVDEPEFNHHFGAFYDLFRPKLKAALPERIPDEDDDEEDGGSGEAGDALASGLSALAAPAGLRTGGYHGHHGRFYTCTAATALDTVTPALETAQNTAHAQGADSQQQTASLEVHDDEFRTNESHAREDT
jgi:hypothetical protein